ncbi:retrovirus-related pol polyprotein from transposon TNT 1-94, partial [Tanacetum coccineum]
MSFHSFEEVASDPSLKYEITCEFETKKLSPDSTYATFLIYKQESKNAQPRPAQVKDVNLRSGDPFHIYLCTPQTPVIKKSVDEQSYNTSHRPKMKGLPQLRNDGWMEVQIWEFQTNANAAKFVMHLQLYSYDKSALKGLEVRVFCTTHCGLVTLGMERGFLSQKGSGVGRGVKEKQGSMADKSVEKEKQNSLEDNTVLESFPPLSTPVTSEAGIAPGGNGIDVVVPVESIRTVSDRFANTVYGFFLRKRVAYPVVNNYVRNTWGKFGLVRSMFSASTGL